MKKLWLNITLVGAILLLWAAGIVAAGDLLTLRGAVEQTVRQNPRMRLAEYGLSKSVIEYDKKKDIADGYRKIMFSFTENFEGEAALFWAAIVEPVMAEREKLRAEKQKEFTRNQLAFEAQESYLRLIKTKEQEAIAARSLGRARELKRLADVGFQAGTMARSEVMRAEAQVSAMEAAYLQLESAVAIAEATLNMTMGREFAAPMQLGKEFNLPEVDEIHLDLDLELGIARALNNNIDVLSARSGAAIADARMEYASYRFGNYYKEDYAIAEISQEEAALHVKLVEDRVRLEIFALYQRLAGKEKQLEALQKSVDLAAESYRISVLRYELGVATQGEVVDALLNLSDQEAKLLNEQFDYYLDYLNWRLKTGLEVS